MKNISILFSVIIFFVAAQVQISYADTFIKIPCPIYKKGDILKYRTQKGNSISTFQLVVKSVTRDTIQLVSNSNSSSHGQNIDTLIVLTKKGDTLYLVKTIANINGMQAVNTFRPPEPICGNIPSRYSYKTTIINKSMSQTLLVLNNKVTVSKVGDKQLNTPLGNLKTVVIKKVCEMTGGDNFVNTTITSITYNANKYGKVKELTTTVMKMPDYSSMAQNIPQQPQKNVNSNIIGKDVSIIDLINYKTLKKEK